MLEGLLIESREQFHESPEAAKELVRVGQKEVSGNVDVVELAAWACVTRAVFNLSETITRN